MGGGDDVDDDDDENDDGPVYHTNNNAIDMTMMVNDNVFISSIMSVTKYYPGSKLFVMSTIYAMYDTAP